jgi:hypothetical protein
VQTLATKRGRSVCAGRAGAPEARVAAKNRLARLEAEGSGSLPREGRGAQGTCGVQRHGSEPAQSKAAGIESGLTRRNATQSQHCTTKRLSRQFSPQSKDIQSQFVPLPPDPNLDFWKTQQTVFISGISPLLPGC